MPTEATGGPDVPLSENAHCLWGWGPPTRDCTHPFGHACFRPLGHRGRCWDGDEPPSARYGSRCEQAQRPKNWDATGRTEANR